MFLYAQTSALRPPARLSSPSSRVARPAWPALVALPVASSPEAARTIRWMSAVCPADGEVEALAESPVPRMAPRLAVSASSIPLFRIACLPLVEKAYRGDARPLAGETQVVAAPFDKGWRKGEDSASQVAPRAQGGGRYGESSSPDGRRLKGFKIRVRLRPRLGDTRG